MEWDASGGPKGFGSGAVGTKSLPIEDLGSHAKRQQKSPEETLKLIFSRSL